MDTPHTPYVPPLSLPSLPLRRGAAADLAAPPAHAHRKPDRTKVIRAGFDPVGPPPRVGRCGARARRSAAGETAEGFARPAGAARGRLEALRTRIWDAPPRVARALPQHHTALAHPAVVFPMVKMVCSAAKEGAHRRRHVGGRTERPRRTSAAQPPLPILQHRPEGPAVGC